MYKILNCYEDPILVFFMYYTTKHLKKSQKDAYTQCCHGSIIFFCSQEIKRHKV